jgi:hypothetical protein
MVVLYMLNVGVLCVHILCTLGSFLCYFNEILQIQKKKKKKKKDVCYQKEKEKMINPKTRGRNSQAL